MQHLGLNLCIKLHITQRENCHLSLMSYEHGTILQIVTRLPEVLVVAEREDGGDPGAEPAVELVVVHGGEAALAAVR